MYDQTQVNQQLLRNSTNNKSTVLGVFRSLLLPFENMNCVNYAIPDDEMFQYVHFNMSTNLLPCLKSHLWNEQGTY